MITLIHGDDINASRNFFFEEKNEIDNPTVFDNDNFDLTVFIQSISGKSLFGENKKIFLDSLFFAKKISIDQTKKIISEINKFHSPIDFYIWEGTELTKTFLNQFPKSTAKLFKLPQNFFYFLDNIKPRSPMNIKLYHEALNTSDESFLFSMIIRQFRLLLALRVNSSIDDAERLSPWQKNKLLAQSKLFSTDELEKIYKKLYKLDLEIKTGVQSNITTVIDFFLLDI